MKTTTILNKLLKINEDLKSNDVLASDTKLNELIKELQNEIYFEDKGFSTNQKKATKKILSFFKQLEKDCKGGLAYSTIEEDYQIITNGFYAIAFKEHNDLLPIKEDMFKGLIFFREFKDNYKEVELDYEDMFKKIKNKSLKTSSTGSMLGFIEDGEYGITFNAKYVKDICTMMGGKLENIKTYTLKETDRTYKPILIYDTVTENMSYLLPIRTRK